MIMSQSSQRSDARRGAGYAVAMKGQQKPKKLAKKAPQKTLKERRAGKQAAAKDKRSSSGF
jgi:hypothetical protein